MPSTYHYSFWNPATSVTYTSFSTHTCNPMLQCCDTLAMYFVVVFCIPADVSTYHNETHELLPHLYVQWTSYLTSTPNGLQISLCIITITAACHANNLKLLLVQWEGMSNRIIMSIQYDIMSLTWIFVTYLNILSLTWIYSLKQYDTLLT